MYMHTFKHYASNQVRTIKKWLRRLTCALIVRVHMSQLSACHSCVHVTVVCMSQLCACHSCVHVTVVRMSQLCACHCCPHVTVVYSTPAHMPKNFHGTPAMHSCIPTPPQGSVHLQWDGSWMASYHIYNIYTGEALLNTAALEQ